MDIAARLQITRHMVYIMVVVGSFFALAAHNPAMAQFAEFASDDETEPRRFIGIIGGQVARITGEKPDVNIALVFNGYMAFSDGATTAGGLAILTGGLGRRDLVHLGISCTHYFSNELGRGLFVQANAGVAQLYENIITFNVSPSIAFGSYISAGYSLEIARSLPALQVGVVQGLFAFGGGYYPLGIQLCAVF